MCQKYFEWITSWHLGNTGGIYKWHFSFASTLDLRLPQFFNSSSLQTDTVEDDQQVFQALILIWLLLCKGFGFGSIGSLWEVIRGWLHLHWPLQGKAEPASQVGDASLNLRKGKNARREQKKVRNRQCQVRQQKKLHADVSEGAAVCGGPALEQKRERRSDGEKLPSALWVQPLPHAAHCGTECQLYTEHPLHLLGGLNSKDHIWKSFLKNSDNEVLSRPCSVTYQ